MLKIKDDVDLKELEKFNYKKHGGKEKCWHFYYYTKEIYGIINCYLIKIDAHTREIITYKNLSYDKSFAFVKKIEKKRLIKHLIKADLVEVVE